MANILIIDDDAALLSLIEGVLLTAGHSVIKALNGQLGIAAARGEAPDLVITDVFMPEKDGFEVIRELRRLTPNLPLIAISSGGQMAGINIDKMPELLGAKMMLKKPLVPKQILDAVDRCLRRTG